MTHPPDPSLAGTFADWAVFAAMFLFGLWRRRKQNETFAKDVTKKVDLSLEAKVLELEEIVKELKSAKEADQTRTAIMTEKMNHLDGTMSAMGTRLDKFEATLPRAEGVLEKVLNVLERLHAKTLVEKPIEGSGGLVALKKKEDKA